MANLRGMKWFDNSIQFPRLLAEIAAVVEFTDEQKLALQETTDLTWEEILILFERAELEFSEIKRKALSSPFLG